MLLLLLLLSIQGGGSLDNAIADGWRRCGTYVQPREPRDFRHYEYKILSVRMGNMHEPRGLMTRCDWAVSWDNNFYGAVNRPRVICVAAAAIGKVWSFLASWHHPFVLVTMGGDMTIPLGNAASSYPHFGRPDGGEAFHALMNNPELLHWYCENHDLNHAKMSTLPTGFSDNFILNPSILYLTLLRFMSTKYYGLKSLRQRNKLTPILVVDRIRNGEGQFSDRRKMHGLCRNASFCKTALNIGEKGLSHEAFLEQVISHRFILCTHGGGIDPSPKAWESILLGTIPIIEHSTLDDAYRKLPVVIVPSIAEFFAQGEAKCRKQMQNWMTELSPYYDKGPQRDQVLYTLTTEYWWYVILTKYYKLMSDSEKMAITKMKLNYKFQNGEPIASVFSGKPKRLASWWIPWQ